ncbi:hypothetical protein RHMOL_Rhmol10G0226200 [Rhododendron molle]|uniref:Uncharacterized protein n=1 Tax=Rhododendron molle TaxID=49168 RepID=A0ACC0M581_RHOML|nr:hypothetical protein RHMOL_Rhmol10G0226200 [Rhododendron molle]
MVQAISFNSILYHSPPQSSIEGFQLAKRIFIQQVELIKKLDDILMEALDNKPSERDESTNDVQNKSSGEQSESDKSDEGSESDKSEGVKKVTKMTRVKKVNKWMGVKKEKEMRVGDIPIYTPEHVTIHDIAQACIYGHVDERLGGQNEQGEEEFDQQNKGEVDKEKEMNEWMNKLVLKVKNLPLSDIPMFMYTRLWVLCPEVYGALDEGQFNTSQLKDLEENDLQKRLLVWFVLSPLNS